MLSHSFKMPWLSGGLFLLYGLLNLLQALQSSAQVHNGRDLYYNTGQTVSLECTLSNDNDVTKAWRYYSDDSDRRADVIATNDNIMSASRYYGRTRVVIESHVYNLTITNLQLNDTGVYKCSTMSTRVDEYRLYVFTDGYPRCAVDDIPQNQNYHMANQSVILTCESGVENNYPEIRWFREGSESQLPSSTQGNTLRTQITISEEDEDVPFTCVVGIGDVTSLPSCSVIPLASKPTANISPSVARGNIGEVVIFTCTGSAKNGDISITWDNSALLQYHGRYETFGSELWIRDLKPTDHETNVVCIVRANTVGTEEVATATLLINEYPKTNVAAGLTDVPNKENNLNASSNGLGLIVGLIMAVMLALILVTLLIFLFMKRNKSRIKRYPSYPEQSGKVDEYDDISVKGSTRLSADSVEYTGVGSVTFQRKEDQAIEIGSYDSVEVNGGIVTKPTNDYSHNYEKMDISKGIQEYQASDQAADETPPVYAEVNKRGSKLETSNLQEGVSHISSGKPDGYARIEEDKFKRIENKMTSDDAEYAQVNKKTESRKEILEEGYAKPDLHNTHSGHGDIADSSNDLLVENGKKQPGAPRYAKVVKEKSVSQIEVLEEVYSEPNAHQEHDHEESSGNLAQSVKEVKSNKDSLDGYAKPIFDGSDNNRQGSADGDGLANDTEAEYAVADITNDGGIIAGYSKPEFILPVEPVESLPESTDPASPLYAEVQKKEDGHNAQAQDGVLDSNKKEKPKYAKVKKGPKK